MSGSARHNFDADAVARIFREEATALATDLAEAFAGAETGGEVVGVIGVLSKAGKSPPPSNPGDPPNWRTGTMAQSWRTRVKKDGDPIVAVAGTNVKYAQWLETGTKRNGKPHMLARPFVGAAMDSMEPYAEKRIAKAAANVKERVGQIGGTL